MADELFGPWTHQRRHVWIVLAGVACLIFGWRFIESFRPPPTLVLDFFQEYASARNYREGLPVYTEQTVTVPRYLGLDPQQNDPYHFIRFNAHPPASVLLALPLTKLSYSDAFLVWNLLALAALALSLGLALQALKVHFTLWSCLPLLVLLLASNPLRQQFNQGQLTALLLLLSTGAWVADRAGRPWLMGALLGLATALKLFPGFLFLYPLCRGQWRSLVAGVLAFGVLNGLALALFGPEPFWDYYQKVLPHLGIYRDVWLNSSWNGYWHKLFDSRSGHTLPLTYAPGFAALGTASCCGIVVTVVAYWIRQAQTRSQQDLAYGLTLSGMLLVSPITWEHSSLLLALPFLVFWQQSQREGAVRLALQVLLIALSIDARTLWKITVPGVGEMDGQVANAWQTLTFLSWFTYAYVALFGLLAARLRLVQESLRQSPERQRRVQPARR